MFQKHSEPSRILIIWNDPDVTGVFSHVFKLPEYSVHVVTSLSAGLTLIKGHYPDLLILPRAVAFASDGLKFCQQLRSNSELHYFPIIVGWMDTAWAGELYLSPQECIQKAFEIGANACFGRVFDISDIVPLVETLLENPTLTKLADRQTVYFAQRELLGLPPKNQGI